MNKLKFENVSGLIVVDVLINDELKKFIVDTGNNRIVLNSKYYDKGNKTDLIKAETNTKSNFFKLESEDIIVDKITIGNDTILSCECILLDLSFVEIKLRNQYKIDGLIGVEYLKEKVIMIDYKNLEIDFDYDDNEHIKNSFSFELKEHFMIITGNISNNEYRFILDSGANGNLFDVKHIPGLTKNNLISDFESKEVEIYGHKVQKNSGTINVSLFDKQYRNLKINFTSLSLLKNGINADGLIGLSKVCSDKCIIDYKNMKIQI